MVFNKMARQAYANRKSERYSEQGRIMEKRVRDILNNTLINGIPLFLEVIYHQPHSKIDCEGADFTVTKKVGQQLLQISFGISISQHICEESKAKHPDKLQLCFPIGISDRRIIERVEELFNKPKWLAFAKSFDLVSMAPDI